MYPLLNLLPPDRKKRIARIFVVLYFRSVIGALLLYSLLIASILFGANYILNNNFRNFKEQTASIDKEYEKINKQVSFINDRLSNIQYLRQNFVFWTDYLAKILSLNYDGITLSGMDWQHDALALKGKAVTRETLLRYKTDLEKLSFITPFQLPISALTARENLDFVFNIVLK